MAHEMRIGDYTVKREDDDELGHGTSGIVWIGEHRPSGTDVAVKRVELRDESVEFGREHNRKYIFNEITIMKSLDHQNVVKLFYSKVKGRFLYMFLELCNNKDLNKFIKEKKILSKEQSFRFVLQISEALLYLHEHDPVIIHRDVKLENLLVHGDADSNYCIKITDFAFSKQAPQASMVCKSTVVGSPNWMAPDILYS